MKILFINCVCGIRSTGRICSDLALEYEKLGYDVRIAYGREDAITEESKRWAMKIGNWFSLRIHALLTRMFDLHGTGACSWLTTRRFIRWAESWKPNIVWLHNIHGYYLNYELLFTWLKKHPEIEVKWTLHDCWAFTGHCSHFQFAQCERWQEGCFSCLEKHVYPAVIGFSRAKKNWEQKRNAFCGIRNMQLITPSRWLAELTRKSFLRDYPVQVINNKINQNVFHKCNSDFKEKSGIGSKILILGVASVWDRRKGLQDFIELRSLLGDDYEIVLVGLTDSQIKTLPNGILGISRTNNVEELVKIYSAADWFFNPTHEENYPTVNLEARACECNVITYDTGGAAETVEGYNKAWVLRGGEKTPLCCAQIIKETFIERF